LLLGAHIPIQLNFSRDFCVIDEPRVLDFKLIYGVKNDPEHAVHTLICQNRDVLAALDPKDVEILRATPIVFVTSTGVELGYKESIVGKRHGSTCFTVFKVWSITPGSSVFVSGPPEQPVFNWMDLSVLGPGSSVIAPENPAAVDAYQRALATGTDLAERVFVGNGSLLIFDNRRWVVSYLQSTLSISPVDILLSNAVG